MVSKIPSSSSCLSPTLREQTDPIGPRDLLISVTRPCCANGAGEAYEACAPPACAASVWNERWTWS